MLQGTTHKLDNERIACVEAIKGYITRRVALVSVGLVKRARKSKDPHMRTAILANVEKECHDFSQPDMKNFYLIVSGLSIVNELETIYELCQRKHYSQFAPNRGRSLGPYFEAR